MRPGKFDGIPTPPMFEVTDPGEHLPIAPGPFGRGEKTVARVWCPLGHHPVRVIDDGEHLRYATHWPSRGGVPMMCLSSTRCTADYDTPLTKEGRRAAPHAICHHDKRRTQR